MKLLASLATLLGLGAAGVSPAMAADAASKTAYDFSFVALDGGDMPLSQYQGKAILVVNTASKCGFTPQYAGLETLWDQYKDSGLMIIGVPSGDFMGQEFDSASKIREFCDLNFKISFPLTEKNHVKGKDAHPFYQWAAHMMGDSNAPRWNFHKYLIDSNGKLVGAYGSRVEPQSAELDNAIKAALPSH